MERGKLNPEKYACYPQPYQEKKRRKKRKPFSIILVIGFWFLISPTPSTAQNIYDYFSNYESFKQDTSLGKFSIELDNTNFLINKEANLENQNRIVNGYTFTGAWIRPKAVYYVNPKFHIELGGHFLKYAGRDNFTDIQLWFSTQFKPTRNISIILGNLNSNKNHRLIEPIFAAENYFTEKPEAGLQARFNYEKTYADIWVNWEETIFAGDPFKEKFTFGIVFQRRLLKKKEIEITLPISLLATHRGGEIDSSPNETETVINPTVGITAKKCLNSTFISEFGTENHYLIYRATDNSDLRLPFTEGHGIYLSGYADSKYGRLATVYWKGEKFIAPKGEIVYQSISPLNDSLEKERQLLNLKYSYSYEIVKETNLGFVFDLFYDINNKGWLNTAGFYLVVNLDFL